MAEQRINACMCVCVCVRARETLPGKGAASAARSRLLAGSGYYYCIYYYIYYHIYHQAKAQPRQHEVDYWEDVVSRSKVCVCMCMYVFPDLSSSSYVCVSSSNLS